MTGATACQVACPFALAYTGNLPVILDSVLLLNIALSVFQGLPAFNFEDNETYSMAQHVPPSFLDISSTEPTLFGGSPLFNLIKESMKRASKEDEWSNSVD